MKTKQLGPAPSQREIRRWYERSHPQQWATMLAYEQETGGRYQFAVVNQNGKRALSATYVFPADY